MRREDFHALFNSPGPVITPVIHALDAEQCIRNVHVALHEGAHGIFLINHDFPYPEFLPIVKEVRAAYPELWLGLNFLAQTGEVAFPVLGELKEQGCIIDAYWADDACIDEHSDKTNQDDALRINAAKEKSSWDGFYMGGTCFKKQREVKPEHYAVSAELATHYMDAVCTSGVATGKEADPEKIDIFREAIGEHTLALASGVTPENALIYKTVDCFLVSTGINKDNDFYNIDALKLRSLMNVTRTIGDAR